MIALIDLPHETIAGFCRKWKLRRLSLFGSALRDDFSSTSDLDFLFDLDAGSSWSLWELGAAEEELSALLGRPVDLTQRSSVERSENWIRRRSILDSARTIYEG